MREQENGAAATERGGGPAMTSAGAAPGGRRGAGQAATWIGPRDAAGEPKYFWATIPARDLSADEVAEMDAGTRDLLTTPVSGVGPLYELGR